MCVGGGSSCLDQTLIELLIAGFVKQTDFHYVDELFNDISEISGIAADREGNVTSIDYDHRGFGEHNVVML